MERWMIRREHDESRQWNAVDGREEEINNSNCQLILIDLLTDHTIGFFLHHCLSENITLHLCEVSWQHHECYTKICLFCNWFILFDSVVWFLGAFLRFWNVLTMRRLRKISQKRLGIINSPRMLFVHYLPPLYISMFMRGEKSNDGR